MAIVKGTVQIEGTIGALSYYTRRGSDKIIVRTKGGPSKNAIRKSPRFEMMRLNQSEWKGCTAFASRLRYAFGGLHRLADYNLTSVLNAYAKNLQKTDEQGEKGTRSIPFSVNSFTLNDFQFNRVHPFNTVLRISPTVEINRQELHATVRIPYLNTDIHLSNYMKLPYFRILAALGAVSDLVYSKKMKAYIPFNEDLHGLSQLYTGAWQPSECIMQESTLEISLDNSLMLALTDEVTLIVSIGIEFGKVGFTGQPQEVKYAGCGKVMVCG
ncbi:MAG: hypothetical protein ACYC2P_11410 [Paludibacteraceae bacterium]